MATETEANPPGVSVLLSGGVKRFVLTGVWNLAASRGLEEKAALIVSQGRGGPAAVLDMSGIARLDTAGALLLNRARDELTRAGVAVTTEGERSEYQLLLKETNWPRGDAVQASNPFIDLLADLGGVPGLQFARVPSRREFSWRVRSGAGRSMLFPEIVSRHRSSTRWRCSAFAAFRSLF